MIVSPYNYTPINRETIDGKRHYCLPDGSKVPSVTTILDKTKPEEKKVHITLELESSLRMKMKIWCAQNNMKIRESLLEPITSLNSIRYL